MPLLITEGSGSGLVVPGEVFVFPSGGLIFDTFAKFGANFVGLFRQKSKANNSRCKTRVVSNFTVNWSSRISVVIQNTLFDISH